MAILNPLSNQAAFKFSETNDTCARSLPPSNIQSSGLNVSVAILWDIENCPVPSDVRPEDVAGNIRMALRAHPVVKGAVTLFSAYGDFNSFPRRLREGCQRTGVKLIDVPNGRKDAADKAILVDMFLFALDNPPPSNILLISGDVDFAPALHILGQRGYTVILTVPSGGCVSSALCNAGRYVWDWPSMARGEGIVPPKMLISRSPNHAGYLLSCHLNQNPDTHHEEDLMVYKGLPQNDCATQSNVNQIYCFNSRTSQMLSEYNSNVITMPNFSSLRTHSLPSSVKEYMGPNIGGQDEMSDQKEWVQPGDVNGLKRQLVNLLEHSGGILPIVQVASDYQKMFGRPLYVSEYGDNKLVNLLKKMEDSMTVEGKGNKKFLCLHNFHAQYGKAFSSVRPDQIQKEKEEKIAREEMGYNNLGFSSDDILDGEVKEHEVRLDCFRRELQELLVSYSCRILLSSFEALYELRYKKNLDYQSFGVNELEELVEKVRDVVVLYEEQGSSKKFLVANCLEG